MIDVNTVKEDAAQLQQDYEATTRQIDQIWRKIAMESDPRRRAVLEERAHNLQYQARVVAGVHQRALKALEQLENE